VLSNLIEGSDLMTVNRCLTQCTQFEFAGIEYGRECWCSNTLNLAGNPGATPGFNATASDCSFRCPGSNNSEYCGAGLRLTMYRRRAVP